jgi:hypothetical protein
VRFAQTLLLAGLTGPVGDAYDNALAETTIGLYKAECVQDGSPFRDGPLRTLGDVEKITSAWVHWYNTERIMHRIGRRPPADADAEYWTAAGLPAPGLTWDPRAGPPPAPAARPDQARRPARLRPCAPCQARLTGAPGPR